jgi:hypothetical protein
LNQQAEVVAWEQLRILLKPMVDKRDLQPCLEWVKTCPEQVFQIISEKKALQDLIAKDNGWDKRTASLYHSKQR